MNVYATGNITNGYILYQSESNRNHHTNQLVATDLATNVFESVCLKVSDCPFIGLMIFLLTEGHPQNFVF